MAQEAAAGAKPTLAALVQQALQNQGGVKEKGSERQRLFDFAPENVSKDDSEYAKLLQAIEEGHGARKVHYIHARGAMDRGDLGWMSELQERQAHGELAAVEKEKRLFKKLKQQSVVEAPAAVDPPGPSPAALSLLAGKKETRKRAAVKMVKKRGAEAEGTGAGDEEGVSAVSGDQRGVSGSVGDSREEGSGERARKRSRGGDEEASAGSEGDGAGVGGLGGLLGNYGSDEED